MRCICVALDDQYQRAPVKFSPNKWLRKVGWLESVHVVNDLELTQPIGNKPPPSD